MMNSVPVPPATQLVNQLRLSVGYSQDIIDEWNRKSFSLYNPKGRLGDIGSFAYKSGHNAIPDRRDIDDWLNASHLNQDEIDTIKNGTLYRNSTDRPKAHDYSGRSIKMIATLQLEFGDDIWKPGDYGYGDVYVREEYLRNYKPNEPVTMLTLSTKFLTPNGNKLTGSLAAAFTDNLAPLAFLSARWDGDFNVDLTDHPVLKVNPRTRKLTDSWLALGVVHHCLGEQQRYIKWVDDIMALGVDFDTLIPYFRVGVSSPQTLSQALALDIDPTLLGEL
jgi:hypothetical protein